MLQHVQKNKINDVEYDIFHSMLLSHYIEHWGFPKYKVKVSKKDNLPISAYCFMDSKHNTEVLYFSTIGVSWQKKDNNDYQNEEFFMVLPTKNINIDETLNYLINIAVHKVHKVTSKSLPSVMRSSIAPVEWNAKSILFDEPLGESESFISIEHTLRHTTKLIWTIPICNNEFKYISDFSIDKFDELVQLSDKSLINPFRKSIV